MRSLIAVLALATAATACPPEQQSAPAPQQRVRLVAAPPVRKVIRYVPVVEEAPVAAAPVLVLPVEVRRTKPTPVRDFLFGR